MKVAGAQEEGIGGRIILVDDDPAAARFAAYVLGERAGFEITHLTDPVVALDRVECEHWDLLVADLDLPHMSGLDLIASVRAAAPGLPVLLTTAAAIQPADIRFLAQRADAFLVKPIRAQVLIAVAGALIAGHQASARNAAGTPESAP
jgi:DNA-binding response OmpR family regulator